MPIDLGFHFQNCNHFLEYFGFYLLPYSLIESNKVVSLYSIRKRNLNKLVVAHLNISSLRLKFDSLRQKITGNVDMLSETKLDNSFPEC